jgi:V/A-type H+-transporting ATPase subunit A
MLEILGAKFRFKDKTEARGWFNKLRQKFIDYNFSEFKSDKFQSNETDIRSLLQAEAAGSEERRQDAAAIPPEDHVERRQAVAN